ncbi:uncharacterized protein N7477_009007 [Penicillium maclennaniae]|uniref:uncharacterized protein n=1 Tax=Penicillium maclennaniae TaxID=1343394 RepID=UPI002541D842|nr:uncharacterized protein N7477_009007 [Penicillium maclennaniae]KAJ5661391.1 hypothetical protein N7477_009007 [Penicillium maclennaniae]
MKLGGIAPLEASEDKRRSGKQGLVFVLPPWETWIRYVMEEAEAAIQTYDNSELDAALADGATQRIFTDGSGCAGLVGASAVGPRSSDWQQRHLGSLEYSNVYAAELAGIEMGLERLGNRRNQQDEDNHL